MLNSSLGDLAEIIHSIVYDCSETGCLFSLLESPDRTMSSLPVETIFPDATTTEAGTVIANNGELTVISETMPQDGDGGVEHLLDTIIDS